MSQVSKIFRRFVPQILHMVVLPVFYFAFILIYRPFNCADFMGGEWFGVHLTICSCIVFLSAILVRLLYYYLPMKINYSLYIFWCLGEIIFMSFFVALYIWLVRHKPMPYFEAFTTSFRFLFLTLSIPYVILAMALRLYEYHNKLEDSQSNSVHRMRFYDDRHNLKIVLMPDAILYISAEENYVNIFYTDNGRVKSYVLRSSMKALDELCQDHGLVRCHRSYYINPSHIKVLRKDKECIVYAELDVMNVMDIPVTKRYYDRLSEML